MSVRRIKWKTLAVLAAGLAVGIIALCLFVGKMRERKPFVSKVVSGYRYRCTLSIDWKPTKDMLSSPPGVEEEFVVSRSPIREWIAIHLLNQPPVTRTINNGLPELLLTTETGKSGESSIKIQSGYPEFASAGGDAPENHLRIDGCPATMTTFDLSTYAWVRHYHILAVCTPDYKNTYYVTGIADLDDRNQIDREMQAVIASFHVEKVAASVGGKR